MDDHTREFLRREDVEVAGVREKTRDVCYRVLKTRKGKKMLKAEAMRLQSLRKKRKKRLSMVRDDTGEKRKLKLRHTFEIYDVEGHGYIDKEEFSCMMKDLCIPLESLDAEFRIIDVNGDFRISFEEFYGWYIKKNLWESPIRRLGMMFQKKSKLVRGRIDIVRAKRALIASALRKAERDTRRKYRESHRADLALTILTIEASNPHDQDAYTVERRPSKPQENGSSNTTKNCDDEKEEEEEEEKERKTLHALPASVPSGLRFWHARSQKSSAGVRRKKEE